MRYRCQDCSHSANTVSGGACPACGSRNIQRQQKRAVESEEKPRSSWRLWAAIGLWCLLAFEVYRKLSL